MNKKVIIPLPKIDFDPSEASLSWSILAEAGVQVAFATPDGLPASADVRMVSGKGLGLLRPFLQADHLARVAHKKMIGSSEFLNPLRWTEIDVNSYDGILLSGGHAPGMREYLESCILQKKVSEFFSSTKIVGAICHGVVLAARSMSTDGKSVLFGRKTTSLLSSQELTAWALTCLWLGNYYRTYPMTVEQEVRSVLASPRDFVSGPIPLRRDSPQNLHGGFCVRDGFYLSARWPGDVHNFVFEYLNMLSERP